MIVSVRLGTGLIPAGQYTGCYCVSKLLDYDPGTDTLTVEFAGTQHTAHVSDVRRVHQSTTEAAMSDNQQAAAERIREALLEFRRSKNGADKIAAKNPARDRSRYASIPSGTSLAPSPAKPEVVSVPVQAPVKPPAKKAADSPPQHAPARRRETPKRQQGSSAQPEATAASILTRKAQRLSNEKMEIFFPIDSKVTTKIPRGVLDVVETDKAFGKIFFRK